MKGIGLALILVIGFTQNAYGQDTSAFLGCLETFNNKELCKRMIHITDLLNKDSTESRNALNRCLTTNPNPQGLLSFQNPIKEYERIVKAFSNTTMMLMEEVNKNRENNLQRQLATAMLLELSNEVYKFRGKYFQCLCSQECSPFCITKSTSVEVPKKPQPTSKSICDQAWEKCTKRYSVKEALERFNPEAHRHSGLTREDVVRNVTRMNRQCVCAEGCKVVC